MPWCGDWGASATGSWWILPLLGLLFMAVLFFVCSRRFGCMGGRWRGGAHSELRRELESLKEEVRKLRSDPS